MLRGSQLGGDVSYWKWEWETKHTVDACDCRICDRLPSAWWWRCLLKLWVISVAPWLQDAKSLIQNIQNNCYTIKFYYCHYYIINLALQSVFFRDRWINRTRQCLFVAPKTVNKSLIYWVVSLCLDVRALEVAHSCIYHAQNRVKAIDRLLLLFYICFPLWVIHKDKSHPSS